MLARKFAVFVCLAVAAVASAQERISDVIYAKSGGAAFTFDVFKPKTPNGSAVIWVVSGGWFSRHEDINPALAAAFNDRGITLFQVVHGSQPKYTLPEIQKQIQRAVRTIHADAKKYGIDDHRIGISGGSAGGHLSLMMAGLGDDGNSAATDPIDRASSRLDVVGVFFPPTDFLNWGAPGRVPFDDPLLAIFKPAFGLPESPTREQITSRAHEVSPMYTINPKFPPVLIIHGDADKLVPLQQSQTFDAALAKAGIEHSLIIIPGGGHDAKTTTPGLPKLIDWFVAHLAKKSA